MKLLKRLSAFLLALVMIAGLTVDTFAAGGNVTYKDGETNGTFVITPGSEYSATDLFDDGFKGAMPGDVVKETVEVKNEKTGDYHVRIYMKAIPHDEEEGGNHVQPKVAEKETLASMTDFLHQLSMTVKQGDKVLFEAPADELGGLEEEVLLGEFAQGESTTLDVELSVPIELGNEYANRAGEVDWVFRSEEIPYKEIEIPVEKEWDDLDNKLKYRPDSITVYLTGTVGDETVVSEEMDITADDNWKGTFRNLNKFYKGELITYTVTEQELKYYDITEIMLLDNEEGSYDGYITNRLKDDLGQDEDAILKVEKSVISKPKKNKKRYMPGDTVKYQIKVTNTTGFDSFNVVVTDELTGDEWTLDVLKANESKLFTTSYKVTKKDGKAGKVLNVATATGENEYGVIVARSSDSVKVKTSLDGKVKTGDSSNMILWIVLAAATIAICIIVFVVDKRRRKE